MCRARQKQLNRLPGEGVEGGRGIDTVSEVSPGLCTRRGISKERLFINRNELNEMQRTIKKPASGANAHASGIRLRALDAPV